MTAKKRVTLNKLLTVEALRTLAGATAYERGVAYFEAGKVSEFSREDETVIASVQGTQLYQVQLWIRAGRLQYTCDCPAAAEGAFCKHCVAVGIAHRSYETS
jgi:uncharacterized Zn finger protein